MTDNEKLYGKEQLLHFMEKNPIKDPTHARRQLSGRKSGFGLPLIPQTKPKAALLTIALLFSLGGGTSLAANDALPGDTLYPIKVNINERIEGMLAVNEEAKAEFELEKIEVRLQEAEKLAQKNEASEEKISKVEFRLDKHLERLDERADKFEEKGNEAKAEELRARLEAMLEVHSEVLSSLEDYLDQLAADLGPETELEGEIEIKSKGNGLGRLIAKIELKTSTADEDEAEEENEEEDDDEDEDEEENEEDEDEDKFPKKPALNAQALVENRMASTLSFYEKMGAKVNAEITDEAQAHLDEAETLYAEGQAQIEAESYADAFASFRKAHKEIQKAHSRIAASIGLNPDIDLSEEDENEEDEESEDEDRVEDEEEEEDKDDEEEDENEEEEDEASNIETDTEASINSPFARIWTKTKTKIGF